ncbi:hypothetical protein KC357_g90 [Hortaea werneckii]|nr:hypothetical protein KC357_g90 [Hortaea werneckii]
MFGPGRRTAGLRWLRLLLPSAASSPGGASGGAPNNWRGRGCFFGLLRGDLAGLAHRSPDLSRLRYWCPRLTELSTVGLDANAAGLRVDVGVEDRSAEEGDACGERRVRWAGEEEVEDEGAVVGGEAAEGLGVLWKNMSITSQDATVTATRSTVPSVLRTIVNYTTTTSSFIPPSRLRDRIPEGSQDETNQRDSEKNSLTDGSSLSSCTSSSLSPRISKLASYRSRILSISSTPASPPPPFFAPPVPGTPPTVFPPPASASLIIRTTSSLASSRCCPNRAISSLNVAFSASRRRTAADMRSTSWTEGPAPVAPVPAPPPPPPPMVEVLTRSLMSEEGCLLRDAEGDDGFSRAAEGRRSSLEMFRWEDLPLPPILAISARPPLPFSSHPLPASRPHPSPPPAPKREPVSTCRINTTLLPSPPPPPPLPSPPDPAVTSSTRTRIASSLESSEAISPFNSASLTPNRSLARSSSSFNFRASASDRSSASFFSIRASSSSFSSAATFFRSTSTAFCAEAFSRSTCNSFTWLSIVAICCAFALACLSADSARRRRCFSSVSAFSALSTRFLTSAAAFSSSACLARSFLIVCRWRSSVLESFSPSSISSAIRSSFSASWASSVLEDVLEFSFGGVLVTHALHFRLKLSGRLGYTLAGLIGRSELRSVSESAAFSCPSPRSSALEASVFTLSVTSERYCAFSVFCADLAASPDRLISPLARGLPARSFAGLPTLLGVLAAVALANLSASRSFTRFLEVSLDPPAEGVASVPDPVLCPALASFNAASLARCRADASLSSANMVSRRDSRLATAPEKIEPHPPPLAPPPAFFGGCLLENLRYEARDGSFQCRHDVLTACIDGP